MSAYLTSPTQPARGCPSRSNVTWSSASDYLAILFQFTWLRLGQPRAGYHHES